MRVAWKVGRRTFAVGLVTLLAGCGAGADTPGTGVPSTAIGAADRGAIASGDADAIAADAGVTEAGREAAADLQNADPTDAWAVADAVMRPIERLWDGRRGAYVSPGGQISTRLNAELLRIHAAAARADHEGATRHDDRIEPLSAYLTGPALVTTTAGEQFGGSRHNVIHVPGWRQSSAPPINQHPSIDATVARGLRSAWTVRDRVPLSEPVRNAMLRAVVAVATSDTFRDPARLLNQINWNADLYAAAATISGDPTPLQVDYREQLQWFARHAQRPVVSGALPNLSTGNGFHYHPEAGPDAVVNRSDTVEYANVVLGALRYYDEAVRGGMSPLRGSDLTALRAWAGHTLDADWTPSGYLNWETGKGASRLHLRQYWALALDGATMALRGAPDVTARPPSTGDMLLSRGARLFRQWTANADSVLLPATSFGFPSSFAGVRDNRVTAGVRVAATLADWAAECACGGRLPDPAPAGARLSIVLDPGLRRLTVNGPRYATAISPTARPTGGGLEPAWILDGRGRMLGPLGGGDDGSLGLRLERQGLPPLDTQPGPRRAGALGLHLTPDADQPTVFTGRLRDAGATIRVTHRFAPDAIVTRYTVDPGRRGIVSIRIPTAGRYGTVGCTGGSGDGSDPAAGSGTDPDGDSGTAPTSGATADPTAAPSTGPAAASATTLPGCPPGAAYLARSSGAAMRVELAGLPAGARVVRTRPAARPTLPDPGIEATIRFRTTQPVEIRRVITPIDG